MFLYRGLCARKIRDEYVTTKEEDREDDDDHSARSLSPSRSCWWDRSPSGGASCYSAPDHASLAGPLDYNAKSALDDAAPYSSNVGRAADHLLAVDRQVINV